MSPMYGLNERESEPVHLIHALTSSFIDFSALTNLLLTTDCCLSLRYDVNQAIDLRFI